MRGIARALAPGTYERTPAIPRNSSLDLLPGGHKIRGASIIDQNNVVGGVSNFHFTADTWAQWPWSSGDPPGTLGNWIKPQIDAAISLGANAIRFIGTTGGRNPASGFTQTPLTTYLSHWDQFLSYCRSQGIYAYPCLSGDDDRQFPYPTSSYGWLPSTDWLIGEYVSICRFFVEYRDVILGVDLSNECMKWGYVTYSGTAWPGSGTINNITAIYQAVKSAAPELMYTWSLNGLASAPAPPGSSGLPTGYGFPTAGAFDFIDMHAYYDCGPTDFAGVTQFYKSLPVILGEYGQNVAAGTTARQSRYNTIKAALNNADAQGRKMAGGFAWALTDQDPSGPGNQWGLCDLTMTPRADVQTIFAAMPN